MKKLKKNAILEKGIEIKSGKSKQTSNDQIVWKQVEDIAQGLL